MRVALGIEYDGTAYVGWQRQKSGTGIQALVEAAIASVADEAVETICAGRTDAGVHASGQVVHFDTNATRSDRGWLLGINSQLPADINATWAQTVNNDFHARFSATSRSYRYLILNRQARSGLHSRRAWWVCDALDEESMQQAANTLLGNHDFSAFRAAGCQAKTAIREVQDLRVVRCAHWLVLSITANAFLQHMVRNITGTLAAIGAGERPVSWAGEVLQSRDRKEAGVAAPPHGLTLVGVAYPRQCNIPDPPECVPLKLQ
jgi:tRNA pseudouridine38-40 synthase